MPSPAAMRSWAGGGRGRGRGVPRPGAGPDHRADQQAGQRPRAGGSRHRPGLVSRGLPAAAGLCPGILADQAVGGVRGAGRAGPASLVLSSVSTLYFETDAGDGFREPGFSKERRLEPQITIGLLADSSGFPLMVSAFEGNKAETTTMLRVIEAFMAAHRLPDVTVVADAGMVYRGQPRRRPRTPGCRSSSGRASRTSPTWWPSGAASTPARRSRTGTSSPSHGRPGLGAGA